MDRIRIAMFSAQLKERKKKTKAAIKQYEHIVEIFDRNLEFDHPFELAAYSRLVHLYEKKGQSDKATQHCLAIAKMTPWQDTQEQTPLYRTPPEVNERVARGGETAIIYE